MILDFSKKPTGTTHYRITHWSGLAADWYIKSEEGLKVFNSKYGLWVNSALDYDNEHIQEIPTQEFIQRITVDLYKETFDAKWDEYRANTVDEAMWQGLKDISWELHKALKEVQE